MQAASHVTVQCLWFLFIIIVISYVRATINSLHVVVEFRNTLEYAEHAQNYPVMFKTFGDDYDLTQ